jgi:catechol 2,3-dioxygenase-like lactoylglutathione lyase family enzyme
MTSSPRAWALHFKAAHLTTALLLLSPLATSAAQPPASAPRAIFHHVHLTALDPAAALDWYLKHLGGQMTKVGPFNAVLSNNINILFTKGRDGYAGSVGSSVDHIGFSYDDIDAKMKELEAAGVEIVSGVEQEGPIKFAFVKDPFGTLIEIVQDPEIKGFHHIHLATTDPQATLKWYADAFGGEITRFAGLIPGIRYGNVWTLAKKVPEARAATKGRAIDHVSWGFGDLDAAAVELKAKGIKFVSGPISFGGGKIAFIEGPDGVRIELVGPGKPAAAKDASNNRPVDSVAWRPLFDGKSLEGWIQRGGAARYRVDGGDIVGTSVPNTSNSFLCTQQSFGDFVLEVEFKVDPKLNSGIQVRSECFDEPKESERNGSKRTIPAGRVHGYQVEIDPSDRAWSGGIYDEGRRGWLNDLAKNESARKAFKPDQWNAFRVECRGDFIKTWINAVPAADLHDSMTPRGFIALQVHGVGPSTDAREVRWRNIRIQELR